MAANRTKRRLLLSRGICVSIVTLAVTVVVHLAGRERLNVLLITLDTTRADRLGCYGYARAHTPALDRLAREGILFTRAYCPCPLTLPSHATILTGLQPPEHGLRDNARGRLPGTVPTLAEQFRRRGYRTAAFVACFVLDRRFGLDRGFELYDDRMTLKGNPENVFQQENRADVVCNRALAWLEKNCRKRFFCWVHFYDPHDPYEPPAPFNSRLPDPYDGEIAFMDAQVGRLLDFLDRHDLTRRTVVIACGDHGEAFGEHGETGHGILLYEETMRVPLIIRLPGRIAPARDSKLARLVDIPATISALLGWRETIGTGGANLLAKESTREQSYGESLYAYYTYRWAPLYSITTERWKYISAPTAELYDLDADPAERRNLLSSNATSVGTAQIPDAIAVARRLETELSDLRRTMRYVVAEPAKLDHEAITKLRSLGYAAGSPSLPSPPGGPETTGLRDPKTVISVHEACREAARLADMRQFDKAAEALKAIVEKSPESPNLHERLAEVYLKLGQHAKARPHVQAVLEVEPDNRPMVINLADIHAATDELEAAIETYEKALALPVGPREPFSPSGISALEIKARVNFGVVLTRLNRLDEAAEQYRLVLRTEPNHVEANNNLGNVYVLLGKKDAAIEQYRRTLSTAPHIVNARVNLGRLLYETARHAEAFGVWREGLERAPNNTLLLLELAWGYATCPDSRCRNATEALHQARHLCRVVGENAQALDVLAAAYACAGDFSNAVRNAEHALHIAASAAEGADLAREIEERLKLYRLRRPFVQK